LWRIIIASGQGVTHPKDNIIWDKHIEKNQHNENLLSNDYSYVVTSVKKETKGIILKNCLEDLDLGRKNVAKAIEVDQRLKYAHIMKSGAFADRRVKRNIFLWRLGNVCRHQVCKRCGEVLTRKHGLECSGALATIERYFPNEFDINLETPALCQIMNKYLLKPKNEQFYFNVSAIISKVMKECLLFRQKENGFWVDPQREEEENRRVTSAEDEVTYNMYIAVPPGRPRRRRRNTVGQGDEERRVRRRRIEEAQGDGG
jgi:hypothetical protein